MLHTNKCPFYSRSIISITSLSVASKSSTVYSRSTACSKFFFFLLSCCAEKLNIRVVDPASHTGLPSAEERAEIHRAQEDNRQHLCIPRRSVGSAGGVVTGWLCVGEICRIKWLETSV